MTSLLIVRVFFVLCPPCRDKTEVEIIKAIEKVEASAKQRKVKVEDLPVEDRVSLHTEDSQQ